MNNELGRAIHRVHAALDQVRQANIVTAADAAKDFAGEASLALFLIEKQLVQIDERLKKLEVDGNDQ